MEPKFGLSVGLIWGGSSNALAASSRSALTRCKFSIYPVGSHELITCSLVRSFTAFVLKSRRATEALTSGDGYSMGRRSFKII